VSPHDHVDPDQDALLADSVRLALIVVLETLAHAERLAFVLHDMFAVPFDEIAPMLGRSPAATRQLASRSPAPSPGGGGPRHGTRVRPALVNGTAGLVVNPHERPPLGHRIHGRAGDDRRDRRSRRPGTPAPIRPDDPRAMTGGTGRRGR
jgi:hypothetical protein